MKVVQVCDQNRCPSLLHSVLASVWRLPNSGSLLDRHVPQFARFGDHMPLYRPCIKSAIGVIRDLSRVSPRMPFLQSAFSGPSIYSFVDFAHHATLCEVFCLSQSQSKTSVECNKLTQPYNPSEVSQPAQRSSRPDHTRYAVGLFDLIMNKNP